MSNTSDEIKLLEAEIEKVTKEINELSRHIRDRYKMVHEVLLIPGNKGSMDIERENLNEARKDLEGLKAYRQTLLKSKAVKFNKVVHREEDESVEKEVAELERRRAELSAKYGKSQDTAKVQGVTTYPLPPGAKVSDVEIVFLDGQTVRVSIEGRSEVFNFAQIGFSDRKTGKPNKLWLELALYADGNGITNQKNSERINKTLQIFFETKLKLLNKTQTFFKIRRQTKSDKNKPTRGVFRKCPVCEDRHKNFCSVCRAETEHCHECHDELNGNKHAKLNS